MAKYYWWLPTKMLPWEPNSIKYLYINTFLQGGKRLLAFLVSFYIVKKLVVNPLLSVRVFIVMIIGLIYGNYKYFFY